MMKAGLLKKIEKAKKEKWTGLNLSDEVLTELPAEIGQLTQLQSLWLNQNQLTELPPEIGQLSQLNRLAIADNQVTKLPVEIRKLTRLKKIWIINNLLIRPPIDIAEQGIEAIRNYFQSLNDQGEEFVFEAKLILIGEPGAGKTSLAKNFLNPKVR